MLSSDNHDEILAHLRSQESLLGDKPSTFLIDGPSGAGKTFLAQELARMWESELYVLHMDDIYPGWDGLAEASELLQEILRQRWEYEAVRWQKYDWFSRTHTVWNTIPVDVPLLVEGCGTMAKGSEHFSHARLWCDAPEDVRKKRALSRGGEDFEAHWDSWEEGYLAYMREHQPQQRATRKVITKTDTLEV